MENSVIDRIRQFCKENSYSNKKLAELLNMQQKTVNNYINGSRKPSDLFIRNVIRTFGLNSDWVLFGNGAMINNDNNKSMECDSKPNAIGIRYHSYIDATAGNAMVFDDERESGYSIINVPGFEDCTDAVNVWGDSMYPVLNSGEIILLKEWKESFINFGKIYLIVTKNGNRMVKYLKPSDKEGMVRCVSENPEHPPFDIPINSVHKFYIVKGHIEKCEI